MEEKVVTILNEMSEYLSIPQMKKLQEVMVNTFAENQADTKKIENKEFLQMFLDAKKIEGCFRADNSILSCDGGAYAVLH